MCSKKLEHKFQKIRTDQTSKNAVISTLFSIFTPVLLLCLNTPGSVVVVRFAPGAHGRQGEIVTGRSVGFAARPGAGLSGTLGRGFCVPERLERPPRGAAAPHGVSTVGFQLRYGRRNLSKNVENRRLTRGGYRPPPTGTGQTSCQNRNRLRLVC